MSRLDILSGGAAQGLVGSLATKFKAETDLEIAGEFGAVGIMADKLRAGTPTDLIILTAALLTKLADEKLVIAASITDVGLVETALAVRAGDAPVIARDADSLRDALLAADEIYVPDTKASTAGVHVAKVLEQIGVAERVTDRLRIFPNGATAMRELAASKARRPIGCTQSTEIISTTGVTLSGVLPTGCELATMYSAAVTAIARHVVEAQRLIDLLVGTEQRREREQAGFVSRA